MFPFLFVYSSLSCLRAAFQVGSHVTKMVTSPDLVLSSEVQRRSFFGFFLEKSPNFFNGPEVGRVIIKTLLYYFKLKCRETCRTLFL